jgi:hypothetical protein
MAKAVQLRKRDVAQLARQILDALQTEHKGHLQKELNRVSMFIPALHSLDSFEKERLEALEGVMLSLGSPVEVRVHAATHLLQQLAGVDSEPVSGRSPRS